MITIYQIFCIDKIPAMGNKTIYTTKSNIVKD